MARLQLELEPDQLVAGTRYTGHVVVHTSAAKSVDRIGVRVELDERWLWPFASKNARKGAMRYPLCERDASGPVQLPAGTSRFPVAFDVPAAAPPTHETGPVTVTCTAVLAAGGTERTLPLRVHMAPIRGDRGAPIVRTGGAEARLELALPASTYAAGEWIEGRVALFGERDRARELVVAFTPLLELRRWREPIEERDITIAQRLPLPAAPAGTAVPFAVQIPAERAPTLDCAAHAIRWQLTVRSGNPGDVAPFTQIVPITIAPAGSELGPLPPMPALSGRDDYAQLAALAPPDWRFVASEAVQTGPADRAAIGIDYRDERARFRLTLDFAPLGIDLRVTPTSRLRDLFSRDLAIGIADFDRTHRVETAHPAHATAFLRAALPALAAVPGLTPASWADSRLVCELPFSALDAAAVATAHAALVQMRAAVTAARALVDPAAPAGPYR